MVYYILLETSNFCHEESSDDSSESDDDREFDAPELQQNTHFARSKDVVTTNSQYVIKLLKETIYNSLFTYWDQPITIGLLATLLDPRLKMLSSWNEEIQEKAR